MKYELNLPDHIDRRLSQKASETGQDVLQLIHLAVGRFVNEDEATPTNREWSEDAERRRRELIDRDIAGTITAEEKAELARLDRLTNEHFDRIAPPPIAGAKRLHERLLQNRADRH